MGTQLPLLIIGKAFVVIPILLKLQRDFGYSLNIGDRRCPQRAKAPGIRVLFDSSLLFGLGKNCIRKHEPLNDM